MPLNSILLSKSRLVHSTHPLYETSTLDYSARFAERKVSILDPPNWYLHTATPNDSRTGTSSRSSEETGIVWERISRRRRSDSHPKTVRCEAECCKQCCTVELWVKPVGFRMSSARWLKNLCDLMLTLDLTNYFHYKVVDQNYAFVPSRVARLCSCNGISMLELTSS